jgi:S-formylglutathione hydrolase
VKSPWGKGFGTYLGRGDQEQWKAYDATELVNAGHTDIPVLIDQGTDDEFLSEQLFPQDLQTAYEKQGGSITLRMQECYDHSYHFIGTLIGEHLTYHAKALRG